MRRYLLFLLALPLCAAPTVTVSATAQTLLGTNQNISLQVDLVDPNNTGLLRVNGTQIIPIMTASTVTPGATATVGPIYGNDVIKDGFGNLNSTYYRVRVFTVINNIISSTAAFQQFFAFTGAGTVDLATATPLAPSFMTGTNGSVAIPGALTASGASTFNGPVSTYGGTCTVASLQAAITTASTLGGTVDYRACTTISTNITNATGSVIIPANVTVLLGPSTWTCTITTASTPCWWLQGSGAQLVGAGSGSSNQGVDPGTSAALGITNLLCSSCGTTTDMVRAFVPTASRTTALASILFSNVVAGLWINMGNSGRDAVYITSSYKGDFHDIQGFNFVGNGLHIEADVSTTFGVASYNWTASRIMMQPIAANTTGAACFIDAQNGEVAYFRMDTIRCRGNFQTGGGLAGLLMQTSGAQTQSIDSAQITQSTFGDPNPAAQGGGWGVKMKGTGSWPASSAATINNITFSGILLEHQFGPAAGTGMGCTNGSDVASGSPCGSISLQSLQAGGWTLGIDQANIGEGNSQLSVSLQDFGSPGLRVGGTDTGPNAQMLRVDGQANATAINQNSYGAIVYPKFHDKGFTGQSAYGLDVSPLLASGANSANFSNWAALHVDGSGLPNGVGLYVTNSVGRFAQGVRLDESGQPAGAGAGVDVCFGDSAAHQIRCSINNSAYGPLVTAAPCSTLQRNETGVDNNLLTCAIPAQAGSYRVRFVLDVSAANAATLGWTVGWTDANGIAVLPTNLAVFNQGVAAPALTFTLGGPTDLYGYFDVDVNNSGTSIIVHLTFSGTSFAAKATATVERII